MHCGIVQCKQTAVKLAYPIIAHLLGAALFACFSMDLAVIFKNYRYTCQKLAHQFSWEKFLLEVSHFSHKLQLSNLTVDQYGYHNNTKHHGNCCESLHFSFLVLPMTCVGSFTVATMVIYTFKNIVVISQTCQTSHKLIHLNLHVQWCLCDYVSTNIIWFSHMSGFHNV